MKTMHRMDVVLSGGDRGHVFAVRAGDWGSRQVRARLFVEENYKDGAKGRLSPYAVPDGAMVLHKYAYTDPDGVERATEFFDVDTVDGQEVTFVLPGAPLAAAGEVRGQLTIVLGEEMLSGAVFTVDVLESLHAVEHAGDDQMPALLRLLAAAEKAEEAADDATRRVDGFIAEAEEALGSAVASATGKVDAAVAGVDTRTDDFLDDAQNELNAACSTASTRVDGFLLSADDALDAAVTGASTQVNDFLADAETALNAVVGSATDRVDTAVASAAARADAFLSGVQGTLDAAVLDAGSRATAAVSAANGAAEAAFAALDRLTAPISASGTSPTLKGCVQGTAVRVSARFAPVQAGTGTVSPDNVRPITWTTALTVRHNGASVGTIALPAPLYGLANLPVTADITGGTATDTINLLSDPATANWILTETIPDTNYVSLNIVKDYTGRKSGTGNLLCSHLPLIAFATGANQEGVWGNTTAARVVGVVIKRSRLEPYGATADRGTHIAAAKAWFAAERDAGRPVQILYELLEPRTVTFAPPALAAVDGDNQIAVDGALDVTATGRIGAAGLLARIQALGG